MQEDIRRAVERWRRVIDKELEELIRNSYEERVADVAKYIVDGGKRLRGSLALLVSEALGGNPWDTLPAALALELVHAASLSIDDIIDEDLERRGKPSSWVAKGLGNTVMVSNLLIPHAISLVKRYGRLAIDKVVEVWWVISKGEIWDVHGVPGKRGYEAYEAIIEAKTASLFALSAYLGALAAGRDQLLREAWRYGFLLGKAYQIADDLKDVETDKSFSAKLFREWMSEVGRDGIIKKLRELIAESERLGEKLSPLLASFPRKGVSLLLGVEV
ncbi:MAG: polyprenyl synthetase family protein [Crenarchaeota archaeon]|nr:polyprenyl synthetase family protein [Thermoproteota archaeon]